MSQVCIVFIVFIFKFVSIYGFPGETIMVVSPFEVRTADRYPFTSQNQVNRDLHRQHPILHTNQIQSRTAAEEPDKENFMEELNGIISSYYQTPSPPQFRTATHERDNNESSYRPYPGPYPRPSPPSYGSNSPFQNASPVTVPLAPVLPKLPLSKPDLPLLKPDLPTLFKPVSIKASSKGSGGLLSLILPLLSGSSTGGPKMNGLKDLVINGVVKPLLVAKGGIKSLIGKLSIPIISLILINLEVLFVVWWLWEDCKPEKPPVPVYPYPKPTYHYNSNYNSYR